MCGSVAGFHRFGVDAVEDADEIAGAPAENAVESEAELGRLDLARVGGADRRDRDRRALMPPLSRLMRPQNSMPSIAKRLHGRSRRGSQSGSASPWYARLWIVNTLGTPPSTGCAA